MHPINDFCFGIVLLCTFFIIIIHYTVFPELFLNNNECSMKTKNKIKMYTKWKLFNYGTNCGSSLFIYFFVCDIKNNIQINIQGY